MDHFIFSRLIGIFFFFMLFFCSVNALSHVPSDEIKQSRELHVFLEAYATDPALLQMIQYVQLPKDVRKIIAWHRFPNRSEHVNLLLNNTREVLLKKGEWHWMDSTLRVLKATKEELEKDPRLMLILHVNMDKYNGVISYFLKDIPKERIRHIYLYEDGVGELFKRPSTFDVCSQQEVDDALMNYKASKRNIIFGLARIYPITVYLFGWDMIQTLPRFSTIINNVKHVDIQDVNFERYGKVLTREQKDFFYQLVGFDYNYWSNILKNKKSVMFTMGYHHGNKKAENAERKILKRLVSDTSFSGIKPEEYIWLYKPHPSYKAGSSISKMREEFPNMIEIPAQIPYEIFIMADLKPTRTAGYSSSLFYVLQETDILYFIRRGPSDFYLNFLKDILHLSENKILDLEQFM